MASAQIPMFLSQKPSTKIGIIRPSCKIILAWLRLTRGLQRVLTRPLGLNAAGDGCLCLLPFSGVGLKRIPATTPATNVDKVAGRRGCMICMLAERKKKGVSLPPGIQDP